MSRAADAIARAASSMEATSHQLIQRAEDLLARVEQLAQRAEERLAAPDPEAPPDGTRVQTIEQIVGLEWHLEKGVVVGSNRREESVTILWERGTTTRIPLSLEGQSWERI
jgi:hypothetical protein